MVKVIAKDPWFCMVLSPLPSGKGFLVVQDYRIRIQVEDKTYQIIVPAELETDLASIPVGFRNLFKTWGKHTGASIVHDCLYMYQRPSKEIADEVFYQMMIADGVPKWKAWMMYKAVKYAGKMAWDSPNDVPNRNIIIEEEEEPTDLP